MVVISSGRPAPPLPPFLGASRMAVSGTLTRPIWFLGRDGEAGVDAAATGEALIVEHAEPGS